MGNPGADLGEFLRVFQKIHDLLKLFLFLVCPGYILEGDGFAVRDAQNGAGLAKVLQGIAARIGAAHDHGPYKQQNQPRQNQGQDQGIGRKALVGDKIIAFQNALFLLLQEQRAHFLAKLVGACQACGDDRLPIIGVIQFHLDGIAVHHESAHLFRFEQGHNFRIGDPGQRLAEQAVNPGKNQHQHDQINYQG